MIRLKILHTKVFDDAESAGALRFVLFRLCAELCQPFAVCLAHTPLKIVSPLRKSQNTSAFRFGFIETIPIDILNPLRPPLPRVFRARRRLPFRPPNLTPEKTAHSSFSAVHGPLCKIPPFSDTFRPLHLACLCLSQTPSHILIFHRLCAPPLLVVIIPSFLAYSIFSFRLDLLNFWFQATNFFRLVLLFPAFLVTFPVNCTDASDLLLPTTWSACLHTAFPPSSCCPPCPAWCACGSSRGLLISFTQNCPPYHPPVLIIASKREVSSAWSSSFFTHSASPST